MLYKVLLALKPGGLVLFIRGLYSIFYGAHECFAFVIAQKGHKNARQKDASTHALTPPPPDSYRDAMPAHYPILLRFGKLLKF